VPASAGGARAAASRHAVTDRDFAHTLAAAKGGDESAFVALWREYQPPLHRYLAVLAPGWADDLASESWLDIIRGLHRFRGSAQDFRAWIFTIGRHRALDHLRREQRRPAAPVPVEYLVDHPAADDTAAAAVEALSTAGALALLRRLPPDQAEVISLRVLAGLDVAHVAAITGKRPGAVRVLAHRGLRRLATQLADAAHLLR
jgi:RNA polymerase sigma-70 factor, ECF subfamily